MSKHVREFLFGNARRTLKASRASLQKTSRGLLVSGGGFVFLKKVRATRGQDRRERRLARPQGTMRTTGQGPLNSGDGPDGALLGCVQRRRVTATLGAVALENQAKGKASIGECGNGARFLSIRLLVFTIRGVVHVNCHPVSLDPLWHQLL